MEQQAKPKPGDVLRFSPDGLFHSLDFYPEGNGSSGYFTWLDNSFDSCIEPNDLVMLLSDCEQEDEPEFLHIGLQKKFKVCRRNYWTHRRNIQTATGYMCRIFECLEFLEKENA